MLFPSLRGENLVFIPVGGDFHAVRLVVDQQIKHGINKRMESKERFSFSLYDIILSANH